MTAGMASDNKQTKHHHAPATEYYPLRIGSDKFHADG